MTLHHLADGPDRGRTRVVVTGMGLKCPAGNSVEEVYRALFAARSAAVRVPELTAAGLPVDFACLVPAFDTGPYVPPRELRQIDRTTLLLLCAAADALGDSGPLPDVPPHRVGVQIGTGVGGLPSMEATAREHGAQPLRMPVHTVPRTMANSPACRLAMRHGFRGDCTTYSTACASGTTAIGEAARRIRGGELDVAVAGGVDAAVTPVVMGGFARLRALSSRGEPALASRPFDTDRDGFVMGEGAAVLVLERLDRARARGARVHGEVCGYASTCDAFHIVAPREDGLMASTCMSAALADAGLGPGDIGHVSAHGTSTPRNDRAEARAVHHCFGGDSPPVTAVKGVTGHLIGGSGAVEAVLGLLCAARGQVPPVANTRTNGEAGLLDVVIGRPRGVPPSPVLSNSFGFGGQNACLVLGPPP
ncbi:beta-ketoacyl-[acyl-carrier-protein] synthase family protein [Streptomyces sp. NPDC007088]|uniref:beta-ketoacyl-[acyl-carrier-protein] synthase family protein n=1 Tax=Streptomyces sp. NPDC007088 TaxID=3364773 RepID=UPI00369E5993